MNLDGLPTSLILQAAPAVAVEELAQVAGGVRRPGVLAAGFLIEEYPQAGDTANINLLDD